MSTTSTSDHREISGEEQPLPASELELPALPSDNEKRESIGEMINEDEDEMTHQEPASVCSTVCALLGNLIPAGSALSCGFNLASTSVGAGIVGMPAGFSYVGLVMAILYLIGVTAETAYSIGLLVDVSEKTGLKNFEELAKYLLHPKANVAVAIIRVLNTLGGTVAFVVTIRDLISPIITSMHNVPSFWTSAVGLRLMQTILFMIFMFPLTIPRFINAFRYVSAVGISFIVYLSIIIITEACTDGLQKDPRPEMSLFKTGNGALNGMGVFIFSYMCQINCLEIYYEMTKRSPKRFALCVWITMSLCGVLYIVTGLFGYLDFGDDIDGSILLLYNPIKKPAILVCYVGVFVKICASYSLVSFACRSALFPLFGWDPATVAFRKHVMGCIGMAIVNLLLGVFVPKITMALNFFGGFCGGFIGFIFPAIFVMYAGNWSVSTVGIGNYVATYVTLAAGIVAVVFGTASSIYSAAA